LYFDSIIRLSASACRAHNSCYLFNQRQGFDF
jgi:hypothetical protein